MRISDWSSDVCSSDLWTTDRPIHVLISQHRDGELIARAMDRFGLHTVRGSGAKAGSAEKGGRAALRAILQLRKKGEYITFTPDGPRGQIGRASCRERVCQDV